MVFWGHAARKTTIAASLASTSRVVLAFVTQHPIPIVAVSLLSVGIMHTIRRKAIEAHAASEEALAASILSINAATDQMMSKMERVYSNAFDEMGLKVAQAVLIVDKASAWLTILSDMHKLDEAKLAEQDITIRDLRAQLEARHAEDEKKAVILAASLVSAEDKMM